MRPRRMPEDRARYGWESDFPKFRSAEPAEIRKRLHSFMRDASPEQIRYAENRDARFGLVASSRDRDLEAFGVENGYQATKSGRYGPWYGDTEDDYGRRSCRHLETCVTEFGAQGLELDATLLAWGTDFVMQEGRWSNANARSYKRGSKVKNPFQLRLNAYRVLLTRARDACVVFVPPLESLDETFDYLRSAGFCFLDRPGPVHRRPVRYA